MPRHIYTPSDYSPTYDIETDRAGNFVKLHSVWDVPPHYPQAKQIMERLHLEYITNSEGWQKFLDQQRWLGQAP